MKHKLKNMSYILSIKVNAGDKISQLVILPVMTPEIDIVDELWAETERGSDGFGSSGK